MPNRKIFLFAVLFALLPFRHVCGETLYQSLPFDRITLTAAQGGRTFDVFPVEFPGGKKTQPLPKDGAVIIRFVDRPFEEYDINWSAIEKVESFSEIVYQELRERQAGLLSRIASFSPERSEESVELKSALEDLYGYYGFLFQSDPVPEGANASYREFLLGEAVYFTKCGDWINALSRLETLFRERSDYPDLAEHFGKVVGKMIEEWDAKRDYPAVRSGIRSLEQHYPDHPLAAYWSGAYTQRAGALFSESIQAFDAENYPLAFQKSFAASEIWPDLPGLREQAEKMNRFFRSIVIGVTQPGLFDSSTAESGTVSFPKAEDFLLPGSVRVRRLLDRPLFEQTGFVSEGGEYHSLFGTFSNENEGRLLRLKLDDTLFSGHEDWGRSLGIADSLLQLTDAGGSVPVPFLRNTLESVEIDDANRITFRLLRKHVLPESMLQVPVRSSGDGIGPFKRLDPMGNSACFLANPRSIQPVENGPKLIIERPISETKEGLRLLSEGAVAALDRVAPWELDRALETSGEYRFGRYAFPTIHFLLPNRNRPLMGSRTFRRGLLYGLNRQSIIEQFSDNPLGTRLISGPSARGISDTDPIGYGYNNAILPRVYDPKLAVTLCLTGLSQIRDKNLLREEDRPKGDRKRLIAPDMPELVLAHPSSSAATAACLLIRQQWGAIGIPVRLVPWRENERIGRGDDVDLWYVPCQISEPMVDVPMILGANGLAGASSPYMGLALEKLRLAETWPDIARELAAVHRLCFEETTILPLWQWQDVLIFRRELDGVFERSRPSPDPTPLPRNEVLQFYQNVENWRIAPIVPK